MYKMNEYMNKLILEGVLLQVSNHSVHFNTFWHLIPTIQATDLHKWGGAHQTSNHLPKTNL